MAEFKINAKGLQCPGPIVQLFTQIKQAASGDTVLIEATDHGFKKDVAAWCKKTGNTLLSLEEKDNVITARIEKG
ncbi:sulfurtransferase tusa [Lucifera butyrica]|uniref:Sulfurtransferase tusa n=1 Tax=Lucifera butyrica TaxID=1351585 RepID=A0A498R5G0_9FIRM|nr:sulfurtransferase TusA family protein [Lucifera butyrica]VBB06345.1 sulfurtransferase tusa [Lucifera butyrica]